MPGGVFPVDSQYALRANSGYSQATGKDGEITSTNHMTQSNLPRSNLSGVGMHHGNSDVVRNQHALPPPDYQTGFGHRMIKDRPPMSIPDYQQFDNTASLGVGITTPHIFDSVNMEQNSSSSPSNKNFSYATLTTKPIKSNGQYGQQISGEISQVRSPGDVPCYPQQVKAEFLAAEVFSPSRSPTSDTSSSDRRMMTSSSVDSMSAEKSPTKNTSLDYNGDSSYQDDGSKSEKKSGGEF